MNIRAYFRKILVTFLMSLLLITAVATVTAAANQTGQAQSVTAVVQAGSLNVRSGPSAANTVVAIARWGETVTLLGRNSNSSWAKIRVIDGREGWANASYLVTDTLISSLPNMESTVTPDENYYAYVNEGMLNVRSGPGVEYPVVVAINHSNSEQVLGRDAKTSWVKVLTHTGHQGWINSTYTTMSVPLSTLSIIEAPALPAQLIEPSEPISSAQQIEPSEPVSQVQQVEPAPSSGATAVVTTGMLNVRYGPSTAFDVVNYLPHNATVGVLGRASIYSAWVKVSMPTGSTGWLNSTYTQMNTLLNTLPVIESKISPYGSVKVISDGLNVRSGPGTNYSVVTAVYYDTTLDLFGKNTDGIWYNIKTPNGIDGWVNAAYVQ